MRTDCVGADRLRRILTAMSEASRVEELMTHAEPERFDLRIVLESTVAAYRDVYAERQFVFEPGTDTATMEGSLTTIPLPLAKTSELAVPRSMARSFENRERRDLGDQPIAASHISRTTVFCVRIRLFR